MFADGQAVGAIPVYGGAKSTVALQARGPVGILMPAEAGTRLAAQIIYRGPLAAPIEQGEPVGVLQVSVGDAISQETPLFAAESVGVGSLHQRALDAAMELATGWLRNF